MKSKLLTPVSCPPGSGQEPRMSPPAVSCFSCQLSAVLSPSCPAAAGGGGRASSILMLITGGHRLNNLTEDG